MCIVFYLNINLNSIQKKLIITIYIDIMLYYNILNFDLITRLQNA